MKTELKHTKGEWKVLKGNYTHFATINTDAMHRICAIEIGEYEYSQIEEKTANAKLIAAAPELLAALNEMVEKLSPYIFKLGVRKGFSELLVIEQAKKAINKATL